ncbi:hypothetical protein J6590_024902 [Homalodisca vitripennis]|nr:hypothetical protein J6590_024902 [Homalodisca vitripennis]
MICSFLLWNLVSAINTNPHFLIKEENQYELKIHGQLTTGSAEELQKRLTKCVKANMPVDPAVLASLGVEGELEACDAKLNLLLAPIDKYYYGYGRPAASGPDSTYPVVTEADEESQRKLLREAKRFCDAASEQMGAKIVDSKPIANKTQPLLAPALLAANRANVEDSTPIPADQRTQPDLDEVVFQPPDCNIRLQHEIFNGMQGETESVDLFIAVMEGLYGRRATKVPEEARLRQMYYNLNPQLRDSQALVDVTSIEQLWKLGCKAEAGRFRDHDVMEPDLAYTTVRRRPTRDCTPQPDRKIFKTA